METRLNLLFCLNRPHFIVFEQNLVDACATTPINGCHGNGKSKVSCYQIWLWLLCAKWGVLRPVISSIKRLQFLLIDERIKLSPFPKGFLSHKQKFWPKTDFLFVNHILLILLERYDLVKHRRITYNLWL